MIINNLKDRNNEPVYITKAEWLLKVSTGEINENTKTVYYITDDYIDSGTDVTLHAGPGIIYIPATGLIKVDQEWLEATLQVLPGINATTIEGLPLSDDGTPGIVYVNEDGQLHIGHTIVFHKGEISGTIFLTDDGYISATLGFKTDQTIKGTAENAIKDDSDQEIKATYIKAITVDTNTRKLTYTKGNDTTTTIDLPTNIYTADNGSGIAINATTRKISNTGVISASTSPSVNGAIQFQINGSNQQVGVKGWGSADPTLSATTSANKTEVQETVQIHTTVVDPETGEVTVTTENITETRHYYRSVLRNIAFGNAAASTANCPAGALYGSYAN